MGSVLVSVKWRSVDYSDGTEPIVRDRSVSRFLPLPPHKGVRGRETYDRRELQVGPVLDVHEPFSSYGDTECRTDG